MSLAMPRPVEAFKGATARRPFAALRAPLDRAAKAIARRFHPLSARLTAVSNKNPRLTIIVSVSATCACFAAAVGVAMERDYSAALDDAEAYSRAQAAELATETGRKLDRLATLAAAYMNAVDEQSAAGVIASENSLVLNIALADADGRFVGALHGAVLHAKPLSPAAVRRAMNGRVAASYSDPVLGSSPMTLIFRADGEEPARFVAVLLNPAGMIPPFTVGNSALLTADGATLALSAGWDAPPPAYSLRTQQGASDIRYVESDSGRRLVALVGVPGWPLAAATSVRAADALAHWYGSLPVYIFLLLGIPLAGFGVTMVLLRRIATHDATAPIPHRVLAHARETALRTRLADAERRSLEAERAKAEFLAHMSHELRTPLNAIVGFAEVIESGLFGPGSAKYPEYAGDIARSARALHVRIGEILELAAIAAEHQELDEAVTDAVAVARGCVDQVRGFAQARNIKLKTTLVPLPSVRADATAIKRIMIVLLSNALRFTKDDSSVDIEARLEESAVVLAVRDNGQGAPAEGTPARPNARERDRSFGLGLAMAMALARRMGGSLRVSGALGGGAQAELRLPLANSSVSRAAKRAG